MGLKKNIGYNSILTLSNYLIPLIVFPYISRVLGVENLGIYSFVDSVINYFIMFSMMGIPNLGVREIAKNKNNQFSLNKVFSSLIALNFIATLIVLILFFISVFTVPQFSEHREMFYIGGAKILFNLFLIEWLYAGTENFKYITIRSIIIRSLYAVSVFIFVKQKEDYDLYYTLTVISVIVNATVNWINSRKISTLNLSEINLKPFIKPFIILGSQVLLTSMYTTFNIVYLGFTWGNIEVGYYTTAIKIYSISISLYSAYSAVIMPHVSSMISEGKAGDLKNLINKSFDALYLFSVPLLYFCIALAPQIIEIISGPGYEGAILPMRIVMLLTLIIGLEQIFIVQILIPMKNDKAILINSLFGAFIGLALNILLVPHLKSVGSSIVWGISEIAVLISAIYFVTNSTMIRMNYEVLLKHIILGIPYALICICVVNFIESPFLSVFGSLFICFLYFILLQYKVWKNEIIISLFNSRK